MAVQDEVDTALQLEVAIALLPLIGRCAELSGGRLLRTRGNRLEAVEDRWALVREVARCWASLKPGDRRRYGKDRRRAIAEFTADYVDEIEATGPDKDDESKFGYEVAIEILWRRHAEAIRLRETSVSR
jgi:hypothetical protein